MAPARGAQNGLPRMECAKASGPSAARPGGIFGRRREPKAEPPRWMQFSKGEHGGLEAFVDSATAERIRRG